MHIGLGLFICLTISLFTSSAAAEEDGGKQVLLEKDRVSVSVTHQGRNLLIQRNQDRSNQAFRTTGRGKIQPMHPFAPRAVATIGELELLDALEEREVAGKQLLLIDARSARSSARGTIPGSINIYWKEFNDKTRLAEHFLNRFGVTRKEGVWNFDKAKTLVLFCNGPWCGQSSAAIKKLLRAGYPAHLLKYYRGGMQAWESFGLTVVTD